MAESDTLLLTVKRTLWEDWDPIGVNHHPTAATEYDSYARGVVDMLTRGCSATELERHLSRLETNAMGLPVRPSHARRALASRLVALREDAPAWVVWRQDDNGIKAQVAVVDTRGEAERLREEFESRGHKQLYWVEPAHS